MSEQEEDFAAMFEASTKARQFDRGQTIEGTIVAIGPKVAFVNVGGKGEAEIDVAELKDADGDIEVSVGDRIQAMVVSTSGGIVLSRKGVRNAATQRQLEDAYQAGLAVEGKVVQAVKGGYEVRIARERAFCPLSQIDIHRTADPAVHVGQTYAFRIIEYKDNGKDLVVSRRKLLEEEQRASAADVRKSIVPGAVITGRVVSVQDFGAFVDLGGGIQGLLHVSEMSWSRVGSANEVVAPGDQITVQGAARGRGDEQDLARAQAAARRSVGATSRGTYEVGQVAQGPRDPRRGLRRVRRAGARRRRTGARLDVRADRSRRRLGQVGAGRTHRRVPDPEHRYRRRSASDSRSSRTASRAAAPAASQDAISRGHDRDRQGRASREVRRVRVPVAGPHRPDAECRNRRGSRRGHAEGIPGRQRGGSRGARGRSGRQAHSPQQEGRRGEARAGGAARVHTPPPTPHRRRRWDRSPTSCATRSGAAKGCARRASDVGGTLDCAHFRSRSAATSPSLPRVADRSTSRPRYARSSPCFDGALDVCLDQALMVKRRRGAVRLADRRGSGPHSPSTRASHHAHRDRIEIAAQRLALVGVDRNNVLIIGRHMTGFLANDGAIERIVHAAEPERSRRSR